MLGDKKRGWKRKEEKAGKSSRPGIQKDTREAQNLVELFDHEKDLTPFTEGQKGTRQRTRHGRDGRRARMPGGVAPVPPRMRLFALRRHGSTSPPPLPLPPIFPRFLSIPLRHAGGENEGAAECEGARTQVAAIWVANPRSILQQAGCRVRSSGHMELCQSTSSRPSFLPGSCGHSCSKEVACTNYVKMTSQSRAAQLSPPLELARDPTLNRACGAGGGQRLPPREPGANQAGSLPSGEQQAPHLCHLGASHLTPTQPLLAPVGGWCVPLSGLPQSRDLPQRESSPTTFPVAQC